MQEQEALSIDDVAPILGQYQMNILVLQKQVTRLQARVAELEGKLERVNGRKKEPIPS